MKNFTKILAIAIVGLAFAANSFGQVSTTASATIISPISVTKTSDLSFGNIIVGASGGTAIVSNAGVRTFTGTLSGPSLGVTAAAFSISGVSGAAYTITIPATVTLNGPASATMDLDTWDNSLGGGPYTLTGGAATLRLGGTLHVAAGQTAGAYTATFDVTIGYN